MAVNEWQKIRRLRDGAFLIVGIGGILVALIRHCL